MNLLFSSLGRIAFITTVSLSAVALLHAEPKATPTPRPREVHLKDARTGIVDGDGGRTATGVQLGDGGRTSNDGVIRGGRSRAGILSGDGGRRATGIVSGDGGKQATGRMKTTPKQDKPTPTPRPKS